jgi:hypothetical protein
MTGWRASCNHYEFSSRVTRDALAQLACAAIPRWVRRRLELASGRLFGASKMSPIAVSGDAKAVEDFSGVLCSASWHDLGDLVANENVLV